MATAWLERLENWVRQHPMERKVLVVEGYAEGHQLVERLCRTIGPVLNMHIDTMRGWVLERTRLELVKRGVTPVSASESFWLVYGVVQDAARGEGGFVTPAQVTPGVLRVFHQALLELREAGVRAQQLDERKFENPAKGRFVRTLLTGYERLLQEHKLADYAAQVRLLCELPAAGSGGAPFAFARETALGSWADRAAFEVLSGGQGMRLPEGLPFTEPASGFPLDSCRLFQASGVIAEVRECFRRMQEQNMAWDQVELLLSDYAGMVSAVEAVSGQLGIACTYGEGLPVAYSRVGRAALKLLDWIESDGHAAHLADAFRDGLLSLREEGISASAAVRALEAAGIGWGRERYVLLDQPESWTSDGELMKAASAIGQLVKDACGGEDGNAGEGPHALLANIYRVVERYTDAAAMAEERVVLQRLAELVRSAHFGGGKAGTNRSRTQLVRELVEGIAFKAASVPAAGAVFVAPVEGGGLTGRPYTFVIGMSELNWRLVPKQDPVLLDEERERISPELRTGIAKAERAHRRRLEQLGLVRGACVLGYSAYDLGERREQFPAYELLQVYRRQSAQPDADFERLHKAAGALVGYAPSGERDALDSADGWLMRLAAAGGSIRDGRTALLERVPQLAAGEAAAWARERLPEVSVFDGMVDTSTYPLPFAMGKAFSASRLELYARCPMLFYFREVLGLRAKETPVFDRTRWLDAVQRGKLLHDIFERYYAPWVRGERETPHDRAWLERVTETVLEQYVREIPAPSPHVRERECRGVRRDVDIFYRQEQLRGSVPVHLELQLHTEEAPFQLELSEELTIPLRGMVDRIDKVGEHRYRIIDYKTGKPGKYRERDYVAGGTQLQHALYALAAEQWMKRTGWDSEAEVEEAAYCFPTERGLGEEIVRLQSGKKVVAELLERMLDSMSNGVFPPTREPANCSFCDFAETCGNHAVWMKGKSGERLRVLKEVYGYA